MVRFLTTITLTIFLSLYSYGQTRTMQSVLDDLDAALLKRKDYILNRERKITELKSRMAGASAAAKLDYVTDIFKAYESFNADSSLVYAQEMCRLAADMSYSTAQRLQYAELCLARSNIFAGYYEKAEQVLKNIGGQVFTENKCMYYDANVLLYVWRTESARIVTQQKTLYAEVLAYRDSVIMYEKDPVMRVQHKALTMLDTDLPKAMELLRGVMPTITDNPDKTRYIANSLASCYKRLGIADSARYYYAISAIADVECGVQEHASLRELANLLYQAGDVRHAYNYTNVCLEDAKSSSSPLRLMQMASDMPVIMDTYQNLVDKQQTRMSIALGAAIIGVIVLIIGIFFMNRTARRLREARKKLMAITSDLERNKQELEAALQQVRSANDSLREANSIKESFVAQYMKQCSASIDKLEDYRHNVLKTATSGANMQKLVTILRDNSAAETERKDFMDSFDSSFLHLFPTFVADFNELLIPEERIVLSEGKLLNTDLRIYALIRLGITDSEEIGNFIGKSVKTVYNYRTRMRNRARGSRDSFDDDVQKLCSMA